MDYKKKLDPIYIKAIEANHVFIDNQIKKNDAFDILLDKIDEVASALGTTTEAMESGGGLIGAIQALSEAQIILSSTDKAVGCYVKYAVIPRE